MLGHQAVMPARKVGILPCFLEFNQTKTQGSVSFNTPVQNRTEILSEDDLS